MMRSGLILAAAVLTVVSGCGYRVASKNRLSPEFHTLAVLPLENKTTTSEVEQILTRALVRAFVEKSSYQVINDPSQADAVLRGVVSRLSASPVIFRRGTFGSTFLVTLQAQVELQDQRSGKVLYKNDGYIFREQYQINVDVENFFSELNPALGRVAGDFASSVVTTLLESY
jgi:outer membrane lipopolysaccharide assembly protein LptE/RlpB